MIALKNISKAFAGHQVLDGLSLNIPEGTSFAVMGPSGSGKSVLLKHVIGLLHPDSGDVQVFGRSVPQLDMHELRELRKDMGYLFQHGALVNWLNVEENLSLPLRETTALSPQEIEERVQESLEMVHLSGANQKYPSELSGGMQKRIGLARALVTRPKVILYDEPEAGLDPGMSQSISDLIRRLQQEYAMTILVVTHSQDCARATADRMAVFEAGRFLAEGAPDDVLNSEHPRVRNFLGSPLRNS